MFYTVHGVISWFKIFNNFNKWDNFLAGNTVQYDSKQEVFQYQDYDWFELPGLNTLFIDGTWDVLNVILRNKTQLYDLLFFFPFT